MAFELHDIRCAFCWSELDWHCTGWSPPEERWRGSCPACGAGLILALTSRIALDEQRRLELSQVHQV